MNSLAGSTKKDDIHGNVDELPNGRVEWLLFRSLLSCHQNLVTWRKGQQVKSHPRVVCCVRINVLPPLPSVASQSGQPGRLLWQSGP